MSDERSVGRASSGLRRAPRITLLLALLALPGMLGGPGAAQRAGGQELIYNLKSGNNNTGQPDPQVWVQGSTIPSLGTPSSELSLQQAFVVPKQGSWTTVGDGRWIGPTPTGLASPAGYEYFSFFAVPSGYTSVHLDLLWRADDSSVAAINGAVLPAPGGYYSSSKPAGSFSGDITPFAKVGLNRLQVFVENAFVGTNATGVVFTARITLSRVLLGRAISLSIGGLAPGPFSPDRARVWHFHRDNPILLPEGPLEMQAGEGNIYAPDVHRWGDGWRMFYGGQGRDGHDRIFMAESTDGIQWQRLNDGKPLVDVAREGGGAIHVNEPSAVMANSALEVFYSRSPTNGVDLIDRLADGHVDYSIVPLGAPGEWDSYYVARPSVLIEDGVYKMWFDAVASQKSAPQRPNYAAGRHVGFATSGDGVHWTKYAGNPVLRNGGSVDVKHIGRWYVLVQESREGTQWALGMSETSFGYADLLIPTSGERYDRFGHVSPSIYAEGDRWIAVYFGAAQGKDGDPAVDWNRNRIAVAFLQKEVVVRGADASALPAQVRAIDSDQAEVSLPEAFLGQQIVLEILAEDGKTVLSRSAPLVLQRGLSFHFDGSQIQPN